MWHVDNVFNTPEAQVITCQLTRSFIFSFHSVFPSLCHCLFVFGSKHIQTRNEWINELSLVNFSNTNLHVVKDTVIINLILVFFVLFVASTPELICSDALQLLKSIDQLESGSLPQTHVKAKASCRSGTPADKSLKQHHLVLYFTGLHSRLCFQPLRASLAAPGGPLCVFSLLPSLRPFKVVTCNLYFWSLACFAVNPQNELCKEFVCGV